jgi:transcriptional regulator with XRE-family HTH domain
MSRGNEVARLFGANLSRSREQAGITQEELSFRASVHRTEIGLLERGGRIPRIDTLVKIAGSLKVSPCELLEGVVWSPGSVAYGNFRVTPDEQEPN